MEVGAPSARERTAGSVTACVLTLDEEARIGSLIADLAWADRVIVVDAGSQDRTVEIARSLGADAVVHHQDDFASQRNFAMTLVATEWIFWPDADWRLPAALGSEIRAAITGTAVCGFEIPVHNLFCGAPLLHGPTGPEHKLRLHRVAGARWVGAIHERLLLPGRAGRLGTGVLHDHTSSLDDRLAKVLRDASARASELREAGYRFRLRDLLWAPLRRAGGNLVWRGGGLDGARGLVFWGMRGIETFIALAHVWAAEQAEARGAPSSSAPRTAPHAGAVTAEEVAS